jgi:hypothetical protein
MRPTAPSRPPRSRGALVALGLAWLLALAGGLLPAAAPGVQLPLVATAVVRAAGDELEVATSAVYEVDAKAGRVQVVVDLEAVNRKPVTTSGGVVTRYRYETAVLALPPDAARIRAVQGGTALDADATRRDGFKLVRVPFRDALYFGDRASVRLSFVLPAGKPRSASGVRIGEAFVSFPVWAYGDRGSVKVVVPPAYTVTTRGRPLEQRASARGGTVLTASTRDPLRWFAFVDATDATALETRTIALPDGDSVLLRGWPEDKQWQRVAGRTLQAGIADLQHRIGLPWPVDGALTVTEVHTPLLEGYAGFYDHAEASITIGEQLDRFTLVHEASHAWFNGRLFSERWITEGLAEEYAWRAVRAQGVKVAPPATVKRGSKDAFPLQEWPAPAAIEDQAAARRERFGYLASWSVMRRIVKAAGEDGMRRVFAAAAARTTAYPGDDPAEAAALPNDWRRLVDLAEEVGGAGDVAPFVAAWALPADADPPLAQRATARTEYRDLVQRGGTWAAPAVVRRALDGWRFDDAQRAIAAAGGVLAARDSLAASAAAAGLAVPDPVETAYESAASPDGLTAVASQIEEARSALPALAAAGDAVAAPRDWLADLGLGDEDPAASLAAARAAWTAGDATGATAQADALERRLGDASEAGTARLAAIALVLSLAAGVLVVIGLVVAMRRRRQVA